MKEIHLLNTDHLPNGQGTAGTHQGWRQWKVSSFFTFPSTLIKYMGTGSQSSSQPGKAKSVHPRPLEHTSSNHPIQVVLAWWAPAPHCPHLLQLYHPTEAALVWHAPWHPQLTPTPSPAMPPEWPQHRAPWTPPPQTHSSSSHLPGRPWCRGTAGTPSPHLLQLQPSCQGDPGIAHVRIPRLCLH